MAEKGNNNSKYKIAGSVFLLIFLLCVTGLLISRMKERRPESFSEAIPPQEDVPKPDGSQGEKTEPSGLEGYDVPPLNIDFETLREKENEHIYAWLKVPGTEVDYPVLQHPDQLDYYLDHNLDGSKGRPACLYTQNLNSTDWTDRHTIIYGHNMSNGTMFASLHNYENSRFFEEHPYMYIYTEDERVLVYEIFAAYEFDDRHLLGCFDISTDESYEKYLDSIRTNEGQGCNFDTDCELNAESRILTLSTCMASVGRGTRRWLVQGVLKAQGDRSQPEVDP